MLMKYILHAKKVFVLCLEVVLPVQGEWRRWSITDSVENPSTAQHEILSRVESHVLEVDEVSGWSNDQTE